MSLTEKDVLNVARLASLAISPEETQRALTELNDILSYVEKLQEVTSRGVVPTSHVHGVINAFRDDIRKDSLSVTEVEKLAPDYTPGGYKVPRIL